MASTHGSCCYIIGFLVPTFPSCGQRWSNSAAFSFGVILLDSDGKAGVDAESRWLRVINLMGRDSIVSRIHDEQVAIVILVSPCGLGFTIEQGQFGGAAKVAAKNKGPLSKGAVVITVGSHPRLFVGKVLENTVSGILGKITL